MKIKITEEQYNTLLNEGFFDRLGAKVSAGTKQIKAVGSNIKNIVTCLLYTSPSPRDRQKSRMPSSA